jgi:hypothetical protein
MFVLLSSVMMSYFVSVSSQGTQSPTKPKLSQSMQSVSCAKKFKERTTHKEPGTLDVREQQGLGKASLSDTSPLNH